MQATTQVANGRYPSVHDMAQFAQAPQLMSFEPLRAVKPWNQDALVGYHARKDTPHLTVALLTHYGHLVSKLPYKPD